MSHVEDMAEGEISQRTAIAVDAQHTAYAAQMMARGAMRLARRTSWVWGVLAFLIMVCGVGYTFRDRLEAYATKAQVTEHDGRIEQLEKWKAARDEREIAQAERIKRMADQIDRLYDRLMREKP